MKLAVMQPYFFPYIGYFQLIRATDKFIVFDVVQYIDRGWMNRNRILSPNNTEGWNYITIPVSGPKKDLIKNIQIDTQNKKIKETIGKLTYYKHLRAPYYQDVKEIYENVINKNFSYLIDLNIESLKVVCDYLGITFNYEICSKKDYDFNKVEGPGDWSFEISKQERANTYINPIGGIQLFDKKKFNDSGIELKFLKTKNIVYRQSRREFIPSLSIIDVLMFNSKEEIKEMLNEYELI